MRKATGHSCHILVGQRERESISISSLTAADHLINIPLNDKPSCVDGWMWRLTVDYDDVEVMQNGFCFNKPSRGICSIKRVVGTQNGLLLCGEWVFMRVEQ